MTKVRLHGILAREFGEIFNFDLDRAKDVVRAIDANKKNFANRVVNLARQGFDYTIVVDGEKISALNELEINKKPEVIDLVPVISGSGVVAAVIGAGVLAAVGAAIVGVTGWALVGVAALAMITTGLQMALAPKPDEPEPISATTRAMQESFTFSNKVNLASQGSPVPVGYGRLKVGSQVVQFCMKSFPQSEGSIAAMQANPFSVLGERETTPDLAVAQGGGPPPGPGGGGMGGGDS